MLAPALLVIMGAWLQAAAIEPAPPSPLPSCPGFTIVTHGIADNRTAIAQIQAVDAGDCCSQCTAKAPLCTAWTYHGEEGPQQHTCWLMPEPASPHRPNPGVVSGVKEPAPAPPAPPGVLNVLMVAVDDLRDEPRGFGGDAHTPVLDRLVDQSAVMTRNYVQQAVRQRVP
jgi:hypothetical protein